MVDAEASQPGNGLSLYQILQTDGALSAVFTQHVRCEHMHKATISVPSLFKKHIHFCDMVLTVVR